MHLFTIGAVGYDADSFFAALSSARVDTFCDLRHRRAVRGSEYAFANSNRLQERLRAEGIRYVYLAELAPPEAVLAVQLGADKTARMPSRKRAELDPAFIRAYERKVIARLDPGEILSRLPEDASRVALFCIERYPAACHRSIVAAWLSEAGGMKVKHLAARG